MKPLHIELDHYQEWKASGVSDSFISANVRSLTGEQAFEAIAGIAYQKAAESSNQVANSRLRYVNSNNRHLYDGGWYVAGCDPLAKFGPMDWGQLKPNSPKLDPRKNKPRKYEAPASTPIRVFLPFVGLSDALVVLNRHNQSSKTYLPASELEAVYATGKCFWDWFVKHPEVDLLLTEGAKKVGAAFACGFAAVGLPGYWSGRKKRLRNDDGTVSDQNVDALRPELLALLQPGRRVVFAFDADEKESTRIDAAKATAATSFLICKDTKAKPYFAKWEPKQGKGIDDYLVANGADAFAAVIADAVDYEQTKICAQISRELTRKPDLLVNQNVLNIDFSLLPAEGVIGIASFIGSGKTQHFLKPLVQDEKSMLLVGHLIGLTRSNSERMGAVYRTELDRAAGRFIGPDGEAVYRISTVIDSLMSFSVSDFIGADVILDEVCQLLRSALTSKNIERRGNRGAILTRLREILRVAKRVIVADADLNDWALEYLEALRGDGKKAFLIVNEAKPVGYGFNWYEGKNSSAIINEAIRGYQAQLKLGTAGKHIVVATDTKAKCEQIAKLAEAIPGAKVLAIHSDSSDGELEQAFMTSPNEFLSSEEAPWLICYSPSLGTGTSIEIDRIAAVYGVFEGSSIIDTDIVQMLGRVRTKCDRHIWVKRAGTSYSPLARSGKADELKTQLFKRATVIAQTTRYELSEVAYNGMNSFDWDSDPHINTYCKIEAARNQSMPNLRARVLARLLDNGNTLLETNDNVSSETAKAIAVARDELNQAQDLAKFEAAQIDSLRAELIEAKESPTPDERNELARYSLAKFYCCEITLELIASDRHGERRRQTRSYEELLDAELSKKRDVDAIERMAKWGHISAQDIRSGSMAAEMRRELGLLDWAERKEAWRSDCQALQEFKEFCIRPRVREGIKTALNYTVKPASTGQQILGDLLRQIGIKTTSELKKVNGKRSRFYRIDEANLTELKALVARREADRLKTAQGKVSRSLASDNNGGGDHPPLLINSRGGVITPIAIENSGINCPDILRRGEQPATLATAPAPAPATAATMPREPIAIPTLTQPPIPAYVPTAEPMPSDIRLAMLRDDYYDPSAWG
jgi:hypothetical protein